jgi:hypothetical protein
MSVVHCPRCRGRGRVLGTLGARRWYRCRICGGDFGHPRSNGKKPALPAPASQSGRRIVNERAWRRIADGAAPGASNKEVVIAVRRRRSP